MTIDGRPPAPGFASLKPPLAEVLMGSVLGPEIWSAGVPRRTRNPTPDTVKSYKQLADAMDGDRRLVCTNGPKGVAYSVDGRAVDATVVKGARERGWLK